VLYSVEEGLAAGVVTSIVDSACGYAAYTLMPADSEVLSVEFKVNLLAPATGTGLVARGRVLRADRTLTVCQGDVFSLTSEGERHVAAMQATMMTMRAKGE
jgi:acyl-coenzyme A thioesterase PaaI-like protein